MDAGTILLRRGEGTSVLTTDLPRPPLFPTLGSIKISQRPNRFLGFDPPSPLVTPARRYSRPPSSSLLIGLQRYADDVDGDAAKSPGCQHNLLPDATPARRSFPSRLVCSDLQPPTPVMRPSPLATS